MSIPLPNLYPGVSKPLEGARLRVILNGIGVQSVTMFLLAERGLIGPKPDASITADTGDETTGALENLAFLRSANVAATIPIIVGQSGNLAQDFADATSGRKKRLDQPPFFVRNDDGSRGIINRQCTNHYKIVSNEREIRKLLGLTSRGRLPKKPIVEQWLGITTDEAHRMSISDKPHIYNRHPLIEIGWSRHDCINWMRREYGFVPDASGCKRCPFRDAAEWLVMQTRFPKDFEEACVADEAARHGLPRVRQPAYIHDSLRPLREIDFAAEVERRQGTLLGPHPHMCGSECFS